MRKIIAAAVTVALVASTFWYAEAYFSPSGSVCPQCGRADAITTARESVKLMDGTPEIWVYQDCGYCHRRVLLRRYGTL